MLKQNKKPKLIVILGPTASGKSALAVQIAKKFALSKVEGFNGEIISADSRQVYRGMDIGTGKVPRDSKFVTSDVQNEDVGRPYIYKGILHHLLDVASPKRRFTVAQYKKLALQAIEKIQRKNKVPIICGGTGFYIQAVVDNISIPEVKPDFKLRARLEKKSVGELFSELKKLDPDRAKNIDSFNKRRLIRALEIVIKTEKPVPPLSLHPQCHPELVSGSNEMLNQVQHDISTPAFDVLFFGIKKSPQELKKLIHKRLLKRLHQGMIREVESLRKSGLSWKHLDSFGLEYRWIAQYLQKKVGYQEMLNNIQKESERFAKRQMTWFRKDKRIYWIKTSEQAQKLISQFLK